MARVLAKWRKDLKRLRLELRAFSMRNRRIKIFLLDEINIVLVLVCLQFFMLFVLKRYRQSICV